MVERTVDVDCLVKVIISTISYNKIIFSYVENECESCGEKGALWYSVCQQTRCDVCDIQWHKHPSRRDHNREVLTLGKLEQITVVHRNSIPSV